ncbi:MAG: hypothetical protein LBN24_02350 [Mediterranea sp.]|jgi:hypothetical protein|nr:hypothetical protein [Mediterranea sp.]
MNQFDELILCKNDLKEQLSLLDRTVISYDINLLPPSLCGGKMGLCVYFFLLSRLKGDATCQTFAEKLLDDVCACTDAISNIEFPNGLSGIAWSIHYLLENGFVSGNINDTLQEVDDFLFRSLHSTYLKEETKGRNTLLWLLFYYSDRLRTVEDEVEKMLMQQTVILLVNHIEDNYSYSKWERPLYFDWVKNSLPLYLLLLGRIYQYDFFNYKIVKVLDKLSPIVLSSLPVLHADRLYLLYGIRSVLENVQLPQWEAHAQLLEANVNHERILEVEFRNKSVTLRRGVAGYGLLLMMLYGKQLPPDVKQKMLERIETSDVWRQYSDLDLSNVGNSLCLLDGYPGISLIYQTLLKI